MCGIIFVFLMKEYKYIRSVPKIEPISIKEYTVKQSKHSVVGKLPIRSVILGPSGSGKNCVIAEYDFRHI